MTLKHFCQYLTLTFLLLCLSPPVWPVDYAKIVQGFEAAGDLEAAYPFAVQLAQQQDTYPAWREVAVKYAKFDTEGRTYLQAWQQAYARNQESVYKDFLTLRPQSPLNRYAVHALFQLTLVANRAVDYQRFMEEFPESPEAIQALLKIHEVAFEKAKQVDDPLVYDAFVNTFAGARQIPEAIDRASQIEQRKLEAQFKEVSGKNIEERERVARLLSNQARKTTDSLVSARNYRLLDLDLFIDTKVVTEKLDREERLAYQKMLERQQGEVLQSLKDLREAFEEKTQHLEKVLVEEIQTQGRKLEEAINLHSLLMRQKLEELNRGIQDLKDEVKRGFHQSAVQTQQIAQQLQKSPLTEIMEAVPVIGSGLKIAQVVAKVLPKIKQAISNPSKWQAMLFG